MVSATDVLQLQRAFKALVADIGQWVIYTRSDPRFRCTLCSDPDSFEARDDCTQCFGTGYQTELQRWLVSQSLALRREKPAEIPRTTIGETPMMPGFIFTRHEDIPVIGDRFFVVEWNQPRHQVVARAAQPVRLVQAYRIQFVEPHVAGQVIFYTAHLSFMYEQRALFERLLLTNPVKRSRAWE